MPRITGYGEPGERDQLDYCQRCYPTAVRRLNDPDMINAEHPDYDGEEYHCRRCKRLLTADDN